MLITRLFKISSFTFQIVCELRTVTDGNNGNRFVITEHVLLVNHCPEKTLFPNSIVTSPGRHDAGDQLPRPTIVS